MVGEYENDAVDGAKSILFVLGPVILLQQNYSRKTFFPVTFRLIILL
jgi:hypothetical protein